jgi:CTP synthase (UTP-ammonia lyase)
MSPPLRIGLVGDHDESITAHRAIPVALTLAGAAIGHPAQGTWLHTDVLLDERAVNGYDALWCVPGSPYRSMDGALRAIRHAREEGVPFLGTCGGFQHAVIEYARHVLGWADADHAESRPDAARAVIQQLACELVEATEALAPEPGSRVDRAYHGQPFQEGYRCRFGLNPEFAEALVAGPLRVAARGPQGDVRAVELEGHPYFVCTLFQPERAALAGRVPPLVQALLQVAASRRTANQESR